MHSAAVTVAVGDAGTLGVTDGLMLGVSVGLTLVAGADGDPGDADVAIEAGGEAVGVLEPPVHPAIATTEHAAQTWTSRRTRRA